MTQGTMTMKGDITLKLSLWVNPNKTATSRRMQQKR